MQAASLNRIKQFTQRGFYASLFLSALVFGATGSAQAAPLNLILNDSPDLKIGFITTGYNAGSGDFTADGVAEKLDGIGFAGGVFDLDANIDNSGNLNSGMFSIAGALPGPGVDTLLEGTLTDFGFGAADDVFEFLFTVDGGSLASQYGGIGNTLGGIVLFEHGFDEDWTKDFDNRPGGPFALPPGSADVGVVPVPAAVWLFGSALLGLVGFGRHSRRKQASAA